MTARREWKNVVEHCRTCDGEPIDERKLWRCVNCHKLLGWVDGPSRNVIRIKHGDVYVKITATPGTQVEEKCRQCGVDNRIVNEAETANEPATQQGSGGN